MWETALRVSADGWQDALDPDCQDGGITETGFGDTQCNDGINNDPAGDLLVDAADPDCITALDDNETTASSCEDGHDDDGDGWVDMEDPDCDDGGTEEVGFGPHECNDGIDNEIDGLVDAEDPDCAEATDDNETAFSCEDGLDDDGDGWVDLDDPDCIEGSFEAGFGDTQCNDGIDNDGSFTLDFADPGCDNAWDVVEDLLADECANGTDEDGDGWSVEGGDPNDGDRFITPCSEEEVVSGPNNTLCGVVGAAGAAPLLLALAAVARRRQ